jgi:hypothetical protein
MRARGAWVWGGLGACAYCDRRRVSAARGFEGDWARAPSVIVGRSVKNSGNAECSRPMVCIVMRQVLFILISLRAEGERAREHP